MNRIAVCFRARGVAVRAAGASDLASVVRDVVGRAWACGGRIVAWEVGAFTFEFAPDALEDVIDLAAGEQIAELVLEAFSIGISEGELQDVVDGGIGVNLSLGPGLVRAAGLARIARAGEVLLDPLLPAVASGALLTRGSRLGTYGRQRVRGLILDPLHPWRQGVAVSPSRLVRPDLIGMELPDVGSSPGSLGVILAGRGFGGSRLLEELAGPGIVLRIEPRPVGEPLGALRLALQRWRRAGQGVKLAPEHEALLERLLGGAGLDLSASGALLAACLASTGSRRVVLVDDAGEVDNDTLDGVAAAAREGAVEVVVRVDERTGVPAPLAALPRTFEVRLDGLDAEGVAELALAFTCDRLDRAALTRVARRGGDSPLGIAEALREGLESGDLDWSRETVAPRSRHAAQGHSRAAEHWMTRRLRFLDADARAVLDALAVLGGEADRSELERLLRRAAGDVDLEAACHTLEAGCWARAEDGPAVSLGSATLRDLLERVMDPERFASWHAAAAELGADDARPLGAGAAAVHAMQCADLELARDLARRAASHARAAGLLASAEALDRFAERQELGPLVARGLTGGRPLQESLEPVTLRHGQAPSVAVPEPADVASALDTEVESVAARQVMAALRQGDHAAVERLTTGMRAAGDHGQLADRLDAMACIVRGEAGDALRLLRQAKAQAQELSAGQRCRAALALSVGLAAAGRSTEALLEALDGLARAREAGDGSGEQACARFLGQLTRRAGRDRSAAAWESVAGVSA